MTEKEKATDKYLPAPTEQNQPPYVKPTSIISQTNENDNGKISQNGLKLINMNDVEVEQIKWLWYPYIPYGKITVIQGEHDISGRTLKRAKSMAGVRSFKKNNQWFWTIDGGSSEPEKQECQQLYMENLAPLPPYAENGGITGKNDNLSEPEKQECQQLYIENLAPLPTCDGGGGADG